MIERRESVRRIEMTAVWWGKRPREPVRLVGQASSRAGSSVASPHPGLLLFCEFVLQAQQFPGILLNGGKAIAFRPSDKWAIHGASAVRGDPTEDLIMKKNMPLLLIPGIFVTTLLVDVNGRAAELQKAGYETGFTNIAKITGELCQALEARQRRQLDDAPVLLTGVASPYLQPVEISTASNTLYTISISSGFVDLVNYISHVKAIDADQKGFFRASMANLSSEIKERSALPTPGGKESWSFDTMNQQVSYFNQIAGAFIAIDLAHHYLGHYKKYAAQLGHGPEDAVAINNLLTPQEWHEAVLKGSRNALNCGLSVEGMRTIFDALDKMPTRPAWSIHLIPSHASLGQISRELDQLEKGFFLSGH